ncbi:hypothetical protein [Paenibacillus thiaminolyticus]|uniref:hypothetical protein n=1 Tax=Paenibacillus thiaminolyticus TaxID=49283 RepID=UPI002DBF5625|nr:hypothetical protein [Paenibacillus thiaminolyticus]MEC0105271.1 hypothetical protein [Paenibacillus thiaminolyticus]
MKDNRLSSFRWPGSGLEACTIGAARTAPLHGAVPGTDRFPARSAHGGFHPNRSAAYAFAASSIKATTSSLVRTRSDT